MSRDVSWGDVQRGIDAYGNRAATLVTVNAANAPHVVSALVAVRGERLVVDVGARTRANLREHPNLTLMWNPNEDGKYQLILDGVAEAIGDPDDRDVSTVSISVSSGILHRLAGLAPEGPSCIALSEAT
ncbi:MAG: pyridoxamine 5'-phosphate oxidase family protein [Acidimicrobiia bacterium]